MIEKELKRGTLAILLMAILSSGDMYGYQLRQELAQRSNGRYILMESSMYPVLYRLADDGYVTSKQSYDGRRRVVHYHLTESGAEYLQTMLKEYRTMTAGIFSILESLNM